MIIIRNHYQHNNLTEIRQILTEVDDFGLEADDETETDGKFYFPWFETGPRKPGVPAPIGRRVLAKLTLSSTTLNVEAMSHQRMEACEKRLARLLGKRIRLIEQEIEPLGKAIRESEPVEPLIMPPEFLAEMEDQMLRQWLDDSIPALGGLTPRQAVKTPAGRQQVLDLLEYIQQQRQQMPPTTGFFSPDYTKTKKMLGLE